MTFASAWDGCEWNPSVDNDAMDGDEHWRTKPAEVLVGANGQYRLCSECAALPRFRRFKHAALRNRTVPKDGEALALPSTVGTNDAEIQNDHPL